MTAALHPDLAQAPRLYSDVAGRIERQIRDGKLRAGSRMLGERDLSKSLGVSRVTLRRALGMLRERGLLMSDEANGWFVTSPNLREHNVLRSFSASAAARGYEPRSKVVRKAVRPASLEEAEIFRLGPESRVLDLTRVRYLGDAPVGLERSRLNLERAPGLDRLDFSRQSLHAALAEARAAPASADYELNAAAANAEQARLLRVPKGFPLITARAITRDRAGAAVEISHSVFRSDRYSFQTTLTAEGG